MHLNTHILRWLLCFAFGGFFSSFLKAQIDTTSVLKPELVDESNINKQFVAQTTPMIYSAMRKWENASSSPFTSFSISNEEILRNNFITLVDLLKTLPGFVVSQPGNALEGETFMFRGAAGNGSVKIMINNVPLNPFVAKGMPIGAQLPIRQAERIEVVYGPSMELYGAGACSAIVNIILKETERPVFALADLGFGTLGYNSLDIMFGGKLGKDKNIFRFSLYGSSTVIANRDLYNYVSYNKEEVYNANDYLSFGQTKEVYLKSQNFRNDLVYENSPIVNSIPSESRLFGLNLHWRGIQFTYHRMGRKDHSALGINPLSATMSNPSDLVDEQIENFALSFQRSKKKRTSNFILSINNYSISPRTSNSYIFNSLGSALYQLNTSLTPQEKEDSIRRLYFFPQRYTNGNSFDFRLEWQTRIRLSSKMNLGIGLINQSSFGSSVTNYFREPYQEVAFDTLVFPYRPKNEFQSLTHFSTRLHYKSEKLQVYAGANTTLLPWLQSINPRLGFFFQLKPYLGLRANFSTGTQILSPYYAANTFNLKKDDFKLTPSNVLGSGQVIPKKSLETFRYAELGLRSNLENISMDAYIFQSKSTGFATNGQFSPWTVNSAYDMTYGYAIHPDAERVVSGIATSASLDSIEFHVALMRRDWEFNWANKVHFQLSSNSSALPYSPSFGAAPTIYERNSIPNYPKFIFQWQSSLQLPKFELILRHYRQSETHTNAYLYQNLFERQAEIKNNGRYSTWDLAMRLFLNKNLFVYFSGTNLLNRGYGGIDATGGSDDLQLNLQPGRIVRFGINYNLN